MASNGYLSASQLAPVPGSGPYGRPRLRGDAARAYNAMHAEAMRRWGISMALHEGSVGRAYRSYQRQVLAKRQYGSNAARPGSSNHGWGTAVDLMNRRQRWAVDQIGAKYGFAKRCSDASWEWWHVKYNPSCTGARYRPPAPRRPRPIAFTKDERQVIYLIKKVRSRPSTPERRSAIRRYKHEIRDLREELRWHARHRGGWDKNDRRRRYLELGHVYKGG